MRPTFLCVLRNETARLAREESGVAVVFTLGAFLFLYVVCLGVVSVGAQVREKAQLQDACDAAAYSAAVVQADGLSRMAVVNRAMSWSYVQMTKMQMDYIALRWLELTKQRFEEDERCIARTKLIKMFSKEAGYHNFQSDWRKLQPLAWWSENVGWYIYPASWLRFGFNCRDKTHSKTGNPNAAYIGFRRPKSDDQVRHVRLNHPSRDTAKSALYLPKAAGDRKTGADGQTPSLDEIVSSMQSDYGVRGETLAGRIGAMRNAIVSCNALLPAINAKMSESIRQTAVRTLRENLPRGKDGEIGEDVLADCDWTVSGGVSTAPAQYSSGITNRIADTSYFSGLRNVEEDEILFLNMADGLPKATGGNLVVSKNPKDVRLVDYFWDEPEQGSERISSKVGARAAGLDQWFIRCDPEESRTKDQKSIVRAFAGSEGGIVRGYKNANYFEGQSGGSLLQHAADAGEGVHRANYVFDGIQDGAAFALDSAEKVRKKFMDEIYKLVTKQLADVPSKKVNPGKKPKWYKFRKRLAYEAKKAAKKTLKTQIDPYWEQLSQSLNDHVFKPLGQVLEQFILGIGDLDPEPSCNNTRERFVDKCANVRDTTGLVSEYEWASAYWFCFWFKLYGMGSSKGEYHVPVPMAALHGGVKRKKRDGIASWYGDKSGVRTDSYGHGFFCPWYHDEMREFKGKPKGKARKDYHSTFVSIDADIPKTCRHGGLFGEKSNFILKGFVRIYGDDIALWDENYVGVPAQPWVLNRRFFDGGGTIVVGLAKKQRNFFESLVDSVVSPGLYSAFSPPPASGSLIDDPVDDSENRRFVVFSAARAGYAPRTGAGEVGSGGRDTVNTGGASAPRRYELRWDSVTDRRLGKDRHPELPDDAGLGSYKRYLEREGRIGCVCGEPNTTDRLKHQWNLCQVDWDGLLLPLREAHARASGYDSASTAHGGGGRDSDGVWDFFRDGGDLDSVYSTIGRQLYGHAVWRSFSGTNDAVRSTSEIMPLPSGPDAGTPVDLFRLRRLL